MATRQTSMGEVFFLFLHVLLGWLEWMLHRAQALNDQFLLHHAEVRVADIQQPDFADMRPEASLEPLQQVREVQSVMSVHTPEQASEIRLSPRRYYAVAVGRRVGIYTSWEECQRQTHGFRGAIHKSFKLREDAQEWLFHAGMGKSF